MKYFLYFTIIIIYISLTSFTAYGQQTEDVYLHINTSANNVAPESEIKITVLATAYKPVNAFDITLEYSPVLFELVRASTEGSIVSLWKSLPVENKDGTIRLIGGLIEPFSGQNGKIINLFFRARGDFGSGDFVIKKANFAFADGKGTLVQAKESHSKVMVKENAQLARSEFSPSTPQISGVTITKDPIEKRPIISVRTTDDGGIKKIYIRSRSWMLWNDWRETRLTTSIPRYAWMAQVKIFDWEGKEKTFTIYRWDIAGLKLLIIAAIITILWLLIKRFGLRSRTLTTILIIIFVFLVSSNNTQAATLSLSPPSGTFNVGSTFQVQILLDTEGKSINALDIQLLYPSDKLQIISPSIGKSIMTIWTSSPKADNQQGKLTLRGGIPNGITVSKGLITTVTFRIRRTGQAIVRFGDATRVLLNDGKGTDALRTTQSGVYEFVLPPPAGPIVASETHSDQKQWYANSSAILRWTTSAPTTGYSYTLDNSPSTIPDNIVDSTQNSVSYKNLSSGTHYFHIKAKNPDEVWGGTTHFALNVDVEPPASFPVDVQPSKRTTRHNILFYFQTTDAHSGIDRYEYQIIPLQLHAASIEQGSFLFIEAQSPQVAKLNLGKYLIVVRAYDKAGNFRESQERVEIMMPFVFWATNKYVITALILLVILITIIARIIYIKHRKIERKHTQKELPESIRKKLEELKKYRQKYGMLIFLLVFLVGSIFFNPFSASAQTVKLSPPLITTVPRYISNNEILYLGGVTNFPNSEVIIYLQNLKTGETFSYSETAGAKGEWFYRHPSLLSEGEYVLWAQTKVGDELSPPSPQINLKVRSTAIQFGASRLSYETLYLLFSIILLTAFIGLSGFTIFHAKNARKKHKMLKKEIYEAEEAIKDGFDKLRQEIEIELGIIKKLKSKKSLSQKEKEREKELLQDLKTIETHISKEVEDIEKVA